MTTYEKMIESLDDMPTVEGGTDAENAAAEDMLDSQGVTGPLVFNHAEMLAKWKDDPEFMQEYNEAVIYYTRWFNSLAEIKESGEYVEWDSEEDWGFEDVGPDEAEKI